MHTHQTPLSLITSVDHSRWAEQWPHWVNLLHGFTRVKKHPTATGDAWWLVTTLWRSVYYLTFYLIISNYHLNSHKLQTTRTGLLHHSCKYTYRPIAIACQSGLCSSTHTSYNCPSTWPSCC